MHDLHPFHTGTLFMRPLGKDRDSEGERPTDVYSIISILLGWSCSFMSTYARHKYLQKDIILIIWKCITINFIQISLSPISMFLLHFWSFITLYESIQIHTSENVSAQGKSRRTAWSYGHWNHLFSPLTFFLPQLIDHWRLYKCMLRGRRK